MHNSNRAHREIHNHKGAQHSYTHTGEGEAAAASSGGPAKTETRGLMPLFEGKDAAAVPSAPLMATFLSGGNWAVPRPPPLCSQSTSAHRVFY
jgi:hypothetical protein